MRQIKDWRDLLTDEQVGVLKAFDARTTPFPCKKVITLSTPIHENPELMGGDDA